jgi:hypothetical protein
VVELSEGQRDSWPHLVLAAGRAAGGDPIAYRWLLTSAGRISATADA